MLQMKRLQQEGVVRFSVDVKGGEKLNGKSRLDRPIDFLLNTNCSKGKSKSSQSDEILVTFDRSQMYTTSDGGEIQVSSRIN